MKIRISVDILNLSAIPTSSFVSAYLGFVKPDADIGDKQ